ncbi:MAG: YopX family protein [Acutalibacteraceae bacterium]
MSKLREKIFRGKRVDNGEWVEGYLLQDNLIVPAEQPFSFCKCNDRNIITSDSYLVFYEVVPKTVGEYTSLTDKNYKKIFEGDIVRNEWCLMSGNSVVKFGEYLGLYMSKEYKQGHYGFYLEHLDPTEKAITRKDMIYFVNKCEVIGNIHDNPEMQKED